MKLLNLIGFGLIVCSTSAVFAQEHYERSRKPEVAVKGDIEFEVRGNRIRIGGDNYDGRDVRSLNERIRRLEYAVRILFEQQGFQGRQEDVWECSLETPFDGIFLARSDTEASARAEVFNRCRQVVTQKSGDGAAFAYCQARKVSCSEIQ